MAFVSRMIEYFELAGISAAMTPSSSQVTVAGDVTCLICGKGTTQPVVGPDFPRGRVHCSHPSVAGLILPVPDRASFCPQELGCSQDYMLALTTDDYLLCCTAQVNLGSGKARTGKGEGVPQHPAPGLHSPQREGEPAIVSNTC